MKNKLPVIIIAVVALGAIIAAIVYGMSSHNSTSTNTMDMSNSSSSDSSKASAKDAVKTDSVKIQNFNFTPATISVKKGTKVTWTNMDSIQHNVVGDNDSMLKGPLLDQGKSYSFTFDKTGTFTYHCMPHPYMKGTVIVTE